MLNPGLQGMAQNLVPFEMLTGAGDGGHSRAGGQGTEPHPTAHGGVRLGLLAHVDSRPVDHASGVQLEVRGRGASPPVRRPGSTHRQHHFQQQHLDAHRRHPSPRTLPPLQGTSVYPSEAHAPALGSLSSQSVPRPKSESLRSEDERSAVEARPSTPPQQLLTRSAVNSLMQVGVPPPESLFHAIEQMQGPLTAPPQTLLEEAGVAIQQPGTE